MKAPTLTHAWLTSDEPRHRLQARLGNAYRFARRYGASPVGMLGLLIVGLLAGLALVAPWLPLQDPLTQQLSERLQDSVVTDPRTVLTLHATSNADYQRVVTAMAQARDSGIVHIGIQP